MSEHLLSPETLSFTSFNDVSVLERLQWQQRRQQEAVMSQNSNSNGNDYTDLVQMLRMHGCNGGDVRRAESTYLETNVDDDFLRFSHLPLMVIGSDFGSEYQTGFVPQTASMEGCCISRTSSCHMEPTDTTAVIVKTKEETRSRTTSLKRRKSEKTEEEKTKKKIKVEREAADSNIKGKSNESNTETSSDSSKNTSKIHKPDYIHVRARRGQATDRHSLAERARRDKISKKMKYLQEIVPGCNKVTGKAGMLDEIINYVQSLQCQVEFLSMKLAALNPELEFDFDDLSAKQFQACFTVMKPPLMEGLASFQDFPVTALTNQAISPNSKSQPSSSWVALSQSQSLYNTSSLAFQY